MDAKITKKRLSGMLSYDWLKIVLAAAAVIFVWAFVFNMTATRIKNTQQFAIGNYMGNYEMSDELRGSVYDAYDEEKLSYEVIEVGAIDFALDASTASQLLEARTTTEEVDLLFVSKQAYEGVEYKAVDGEGKESVATRTYLEHFLGNYFPKVHSLGEGGFFDEMAAYLNPYYYGDYAAANATLNEEKVEADFRARAKGDKRYKKEKQIQKGVQGEIERFEKYRQALVKFNQYLADGWVQIEKTAYMYYNEETKQMEDYLQDEGYYSINICPDTTTENIKKNLAQVVGYYSYDDEGKLIGKSAKDMQVCFFDCNGKGDFRYEALTYLCYLLDSMNEGE